MPEENGSTSDRPAARLSVLILGVGDVASAVAHRLATGGFAVALHQGAEPPLVHRRAMSFADAWFDGRAEIEGIMAVRLDDPDELSGYFRDRRPIPVLVSPLRAALDSLRWVVLIDARMRKRDQPENLRGLASLVIGLGPGFVAGGNVDWAVETSWGDRLGEVLRNGATMPLAGEPHAIQDVGRERMVYAPVAGRLRARTEIGRPVVAGEIAAEIAGDIEEVPLPAPISGTVRGIVRDGVVVAKGTKVLEIDPRAPTQASVAGLGERPRRIADRVAEALAEWVGTTPLNLESGEAPRGLSLPAGNRGHAGEP